MQTVAEVARASALGCKELERMSLVDTSGCCERCHSPNSYALGGSLGPCRVALPDGGEALVCCTTKKQLLAKTSSR